LDGSFHPIAACLRGATNDKAFREMQCSAQLLHAVRLWLMPQVKGGTL